jgi:hypothetical protein
LSPGVLKVEALRACVPEETRAVSIAGELHNHKDNKRHMEDIFLTHSWELRFEDAYDSGSIFFAKSPAALRPPAS